MAECNVKLNSIEAIRDFVKEIKSCEGKFELVSGRYVIDAKSIMGIFSLDLSRPVQLRAENGTIPAAISPFLA